MSLLFRAFGKIQDTITRVAYGAERYTEMQHFYECMAKDIGGKEVQVSTGTLLRDRRRKAGTNYICLDIATGRWILSEETSC
jgi:hypothetical protein